MGREKQRRCLHCGLGYTPDRRNGRHQKYCGAAPCKAASKKASQDKWLAKPENSDYHRGPVAVARAQAWRTTHPGYSRHQPEVAPTPEPLQETLPFAVTRGPTLAEVMAPAKISSASMAAPLSVIRARGRPRFINA